MTICGKCRTMIQVSKFYIKNAYFRSYSSSERGWRLLFFGSDDVALKSLTSLNDEYKNGKTILSLRLVTANQSSKLTKIEKYAVSENLKILPWPLIDVSTQQYDIGIVVSFGHLIPERVINMFPFGMVNVHTSLLPRWRGAAPVIYTLLHGDAVAGISLMKISPQKFDVGEIISQRSIPVSEHTKLPELTQRLAELGAQEVLECVRSLPTCLHGAQPQPDVGATYARKINKSISDVRWLEMDSIQIYNLHRAIYGIYDLTTNFGMHQVKLFGADKQTNAAVNKYSNKPIGYVEYCKVSNVIRVLCKDRHFVCFTSLRVLGKREISAFDFYNGYLKKVNTEKRIFQQSDSPNNANLSKKSVII